MHRKFIALIVSTAIAITGVSVVPAHANSRDIAKVLLGLAAVAVIADAVNRNRRTTPPPVTRGYTKPPSVRVPPPARINARYLLPGRCQRRVYTRTGVHDVLGSRCISNSFAYAGSLPRQCYLTFWGRRARKTISGYGRHCLQQRGYTISAY